METVAAILNSPLQAVASALIFGAVFLFIFEILSIKFPRYRKPPGPTPLPFIGNSLLLARAPFKTFAQMREKYGDISLVYIGRTPTVVLSGFSVIKEALVQAGVEFAGRPTVPVLDWIIHGLGIVMAPYGLSWKQQRRFSLTTLRNFGLGKKSLEDRVSEEALFLVRELEKQGGKPINPSFTVYNAVSNIICSVVFGSRFEYDDEDFKHLLHIINSNVQLVSSLTAQVFNLVPFIKHLPGPHQQIRRNSNEVMAFIGKFYREHKETFDPENLRDFLDAYILEMDKQKSDPESTFFEENLFMTIADLFLAGTDTTATTLRWGLLYMSQYPEVQERCHQEIAREVGYDRPPSLNDKDRLPYVEATIREIQRVGNIAPMGVPRQVTKDTKLRGYTLPKGTQVFCNLSSVLNDKDHWKFPDQFNPENFLDDQGRFCKRESFIPFGTGLRVCPGEQLARLELFVYFSVLLQRLEFIWPDGAGTPDLAGLFGLLRSPLPFKVICQSRDRAGQAK